MATRTVRHAFAAACSAAACLAASALPALADGIRNTSCLHASGTFVCTTQWRHGTSSQYLPWKIDHREVAASAERERKWLARCRPVARQDRLGVSRYVYAASGCEFGKTED